MSSKWLEQYRTWVPSLGEIEDDCILFMAIDEEAAVRQRAGQMYDDDPSFEPVKIHVRCTRAGSEESVFSVYAEVEIQFYAREVKHD